MGKDLNKVMATGHAGADAETRFTSSGQQVTTFRIASNRQWTDGQGEKQEDTEWFRCVAWQGLAEVAANYVKKGTRVYVEGRLQTRKWQDAEGVDRYSTEIVVAEIILLSARPDDAEDAAPPPRGGGMGAATRQGAARARAGMEEPVI